jgi:multiple sugar transport system substrate-binding protein
MAAWWWTRTARSPSTAPRRSNALNYSKELYQTFIPGTLSWGDISNNRAYAAGEMG